MPTSIDAPAASPSGVPEAVAPRVPIGSPKRLRSRRRRDRAAQWVVTAGGFAIIASILGICVFLVLEVVPLVASAEVAPRDPIATPGSTPLALFSDEARSLVALLGADGT